MGKRKEKEFKIKMIEYKSLNFLGFPNYQVGSDGSVWSHGRSLHPDIIQNIINDSKELSNKLLSNKYSISSATIYRIINNPNKYLWRQIIPQDGKQCKQERRKQW